ncbi:scramblase-like protein, partial [Perilla frutescens var. frutescens]
MNWTKAWGCVKQHSRCSTLQCHTERDHNGILFVGKRFYSSLELGGYPLERKTSWRFKLPCILAGTSFGSKNTSLRYMHGVPNESDLSRDFFVQLWLVDRKKTSVSAKRRHKVYKSSNSGETLVNGRTLPRLIEGMLSGKYVVDEKPYDKIKSGLKQPPTSQSITGTLKPMSLEESKVAPLLARSNLLITRDIEWANLVLGFEQENRYAIVDVCYPQTPAGFIREQSNVIVRQLLRRRRPFIADITDGFGNELFKVRRPFWWINSSIYAEINGKEIGVVHKRWHLWRRIYDLYLGNKQFAVVENPGLWNWTFTLKDIDGNVLAEIDRDWRGFGFEVFTDAGQYVIRFGSSDSGIGPAAG